MYILAKLLSIEKSGNVLHITIYIYIVFIYIFLSFILFI